MNKDDFGYACTGGISYLKKMQRAKNLQREAIFVKFSGNIYGSDSKEFKDAQKHASRLEQEAEFLRRIN